MTRSAFVSYSHEDDTLIDALARTLSGDGFELFVTEFEDFGAPVSDHIQRDIRNARALIVVLGPNALSLSQTSTWIGWMAGIAAEADRPVWVLEDANTPAELAVPGITDFVQWNSRDEAHQAWFRDVAADDASTEAIAGQGLATLLAAALDGGDDLPPDGRAVLGGSGYWAPRVTCSGCCQTFRLRSAVSGFRCPTCRSARIDIDWQAFYDRRASEI